MDNDTKPDSEHTPMESLLSWDELMHDLTAVDAWTIQRAIEILNERIVKRKPVLKTPLDVTAYLRLQLTDKQQEVFAVIFLDCQHRVIAYEALFYGTIHQTSVHPRTILQRALALNAAAVILAHNHPSGLAKPSDADKNLTRNLQSILTHVDVRVLDHFIVGEGTPYSFAENNMLN